MVPPPFVKAAAYGIYQDKLRAAIHALKYDGATSAAHRLGQMLAGAISLFADKASQAMLVVPVPLSRGRQKQRGFNQAHLLAEQAIKVLRRSRPAWQLTLASGALIRRRETETQAALTPRQRRLNVRGAFFVPDTRAISGRDVLLIDDILTTGATARTAAKALMDAGAAGVWVATLARAQRIFGRTGSGDFYHDAINQLPTISLGANSVSSLSMHSSINQPSF